MHHRKFLSAAGVVDLLWIYFNSLWFYWGWVLLVLRSGAESEAALSWTMHNKAINVHSRQGSIYICLSYQATSTELNNGRAAQAPGRVRHARLAISRA